MKIDTKTTVTLLFLGFVWGSAFILMKQGLKSFTPFQLASIRLVFAGMVAVFFFLKVYKTLSKKDWMFLGISGITGNFLPAFLFASALGLKEFPSSLSGAFNALTPFFTLLFGVFLFAQAFNIRQSLGIGIGLIGALTLIISKSSGGLDFETAYLVPSGKVILAAMFYGLNVNIIKSKLSHLSPITNSMVPLTLISIPALIFLFILDVPGKIMADSEAVHSLLYIAILGILGTALSLIAFNRLIQRTSALFASSVTYLIPVFAYMWGVIIDEPIGLFQILGVLMILFGITLSKK